MESAGEIASRVALPAQGGLDTLKIQIVSLHEQVQNLAFSHLENAYSSLQEQFQSLHNEREKEFEAQLQLEYDRLQKSEEAYNMLQIQLNESENKFSNLKEKFSDYLRNTKQKDNKRNILTRCFNAWSLIATKTQASKKIDAIAEKVNKNFIKNRVFSRFAYNLVSRNYESEKRQYQESNNIQANELISRYESDVGDLTRRLAVAEATAQKEQALRVRLEEDIRRMLLKNMISMNVEALTALKQPLLFTDNDASNLRLATDSAVPGRILPAEIAYKTFFEQIGPGSMTLAAPLKDTSTIENVDSNITQDEGDHVRSIDDRDINSAAFDFPLSETLALPGSSVVVDTSVSVSSSQELLPRRTAPRPTTLPVTHTSPPRMQLQVLQQTRARSSTVSRPSTAPANKGKFIAIK